MPPCLVNANQVAHQLLVNGRGNMPTKPKRPILTTVEQSEQSLVYPFTEEEYRKEKATPKNNKAAGIDDVLIEQLKHLGPRAHKWLHSMLNTCFTENKIPKVWRQSRIIAILKSEQDASIPKSYRPISLLCHTYKLCERLILNRIIPTVESHLIKVSLWTAHWATNSIYTIQRWRWPHATIFYENWQTGSGAQVQARSEPQRLLYVIPSLNMQHVLSRYHHAHVLDSELNTACIAITGNLKPTNIEDMYLLAGIAPPDIRCNVCARVEKKKRESNLAHSLYGQNPSESRLKSRSGFLCSVRPADFHPKVIRCNEWQHSLNTKTHSCSANLAERLARGHTSQWTTWRCLNRLRTGVTCSKEQRKKWGYYEGDTTCDCGVSSEDTRHMLECPLLAHSCSLDDHILFNETAKQCVEQWKTAVWWHDEED